MLNFEKVGFLLEEKINIFPNLIFRSKIVYGITNHLTLLNIFSELLTFEMMTF